STSQNKFNYNTHSTMNLNSINNTAPTVSSGTKTVINPSFTATFTRLLFKVVNAPQKTIPANLAPYFGPTGFTCTNATAKKHLKNYEFLILPNGTSTKNCGFAQ